MSASMGMGTSTSASAIVSTSTSVLTAMAMFTIASMRMSMKAAAKLAMRKLFLQNCWMHAAKPAKPRFVIRSASDVKLVERATKIMSINTSMSMRIIMSISMTMSKTRT